MAAQIVTEIRTVEYHAWYCLPCGRVFCAVCKANTGVVAERYSVPSSWYKGTPYDACDNCGADFSRSIEVAETTVQIEYTPVAIF